MYIYIITCTIDGMQYVGQSIHHPLSSNGRIRQHLSLQSSSCRRMHNSIKKYGKENFRYEIIHYPGASEESLTAIEQWHINKRNTMHPNGYNLRDAGNNGLHSQETKHKISKKRRGTTHTEETKLKMSKAQSGKTLSEDHKRKMSEAKKGNQHAKGIKRSDETKRKMSEAKKGNQHAKGNQNMKGKKHSDETKRKMSETRKGIALRNKGLSEELVQCFCKMQEVKQEHNLNKAVCEIIWEVFKLKFDVHSRKELKVSELTYIHARLDAFLRSREVLQEFVSSKEFNYALYAGIGVR